MPSMIGVNGGTTDASTAFSIAAGAICSYANKPVTINPTSSAVRSRNVSRRQLTRSLSPSNTPTTMFVLPTSMASNIGCGPHTPKQLTLFPKDLPADDPLDPVADANEERAVIVDAGRDAPHRAAGRIPPDRG